jgi:hypothetical protein
MFLQYPDRFSTLSSPLLVVHNSGRIFPVMATDLWLLVAVLAARWLLLAVLAGGGAVGYCDFVDRSTVTAARAKPPTAKNAVSGAT